MTGPVLVVNKETLNAGFFLWGQGIVMIEQAQKAETMLSNDWNFSYNETPKYWVENISQQTLQETVWNTMLKLKKKCRPGHYYWHLIL